jgi:ribosomal protein L44E
MALPHIDVPVYTTQLPSTGEVIKFRPFLVREQKQLLIAQNAGIEQQTQAVLDVVDVCTYKKLSVAKLPAYDIEYLFLQLRTHSVGETIDLVLTCGECENKQETKLDLTTVLVDKPAEHERNVDLGNGLVLTMQDPNLEVINALRSQTELTADIIIAVIAECIQTIWKGDESYAALDYTTAELIEFVENLSPANLEKLEQYFVTMPRLRHVLDFTCSKCNKENSAAMEGLQSFFG